MSDQKCGVNTIVVISPHLDDAVLGCADHISEWRYGGYQVIVLTVFTKFSDSYISTSARQSLISAGCKNGRQYELLRLHEDKKAMALLNVNKVVYGGLTDGWFRSYKKKPLYPNNHLFLGKSSPFDRTTINSIVKLFAPYAACRSVVAPMGIGKHVDHVCVKQAVESVFRRDRIWYYADQPYAGAVCNWSVEYIKYFFTHKTSIMIPSRIKKSISKLYTSQYKLFNKNTFIPEILLYT